MRKTLGTAVAAALTLLLAGPATAGSLTVHDKTGDVNEGRVIDGKDEGVYVVQGNVREGDVVSTTFFHGPKNVIVTSRYRTLDAVGYYHGYYLRLQTGKKLYREIDVDAGTGHWKGTTTVMRRNGDKVRCAATHRIDYAKNYVRVVVPRSCLGNPTYVRGTAANVWLRHDSDPSQGDLVFLDNPHNTNIEANVWTRWIKRG